MKERRAHRDEKTETGREETGRETERNIETGGGGGGGVSSVCRESWVRFPLRAPAPYWMDGCQYNVTVWDRSHGLPALPVWYYVNVSDVRLGKSPRDNLDPFDLMENELDTERARERERERERGGGKRERDNITMGAFVYRSVYVIQ